MIKWCTTRRRSGRDLHADPVRPGHAGRQGGGTRQYQAHCTRSLLYYNNALKTGYTTEPYMFINSYLKLVTLNDFIMLLLLTFSIWGC